MTDASTDNAERFDPLIDDRIIRSDRIEQPSMEVSEAGAADADGVASDPPGFQNSQLPADDLPDYRELEFESVAGSFRGYTVLTTLVYWVPALLIASAINFLPDVTLLPGLLTPGAVALVTVLVGVYRWADAGQRGWAVRAHDLSAREGIYWRSVTTLPYARIQHVETTSGPIERWRGLARLKLFTAGGMTADLTLIGLEAGAADTLREHLAEQIRLRDARAGEGEADVDAAAETDRSAPDDGAPAVDEDLGRSTDIDRTP